MCQKARQFYNYEHFPFAQEGLAFWNSRHACAVCEIDTWSSQADRQG